MFFALAAFLWLPASVHCQIESLSGIELLQCAASCSSQSADDHGCAENDCCLVEKAGYYTSGCRLAKLSILATPALLFLQPEISTPATESLVSFRPAAAPSFPIKSWPFLSRAALPARAPSSAF